MHLIYPLIPIRNIAVTASTCIYCHNEPLSNFQFPIGIYYIKLNYKISSNADFACSFSFQFQIQLDVIYSILWKFTPFGRHRAHINLNTLVSHVKLYTIRCKQMYHIKSPLPNDTDHAIKFIKFFQLIILMISF